jgi:hypothetical protein
VISWLRKVGLLDKAKITREQAEQLARAECERQGWKWLEPVHVEEAVTYWRWGIRRKDASNRYRRESSGR